ncbi:MAG TPA: hypothetical protein VL422_05500 [Miltoncostaea sp.]|nr:hypothetical protein [Miltoncostaea sp.]
MLSTVLIVLAAVALTALVVVVALAVIARRPGLVARLSRFGPFRALMVRMTMWQIRRARKRGDVPPGATDLEVMLAGQTGPEAEAAKAMLKRMNPRQRAEFSRRTLGGDGLASMMQTAGTSDADDTALGRAGRRQAAAMAGASGGQRAQRRKAVAKRRAARKAGRRG